MPNPATVRERRLRKTKPQLIDELDSLERRVAMLEVGRDEALPESEEMFRSAFETAAHGMNLTAPDGRLLAVNTALCEMLGYSEEELLATDIQGTTHPEDIDRDLANLQELLAGESRSYQLEKQYVHKQGHPIEVSLSVSLIRDSKGEPLYSVSHVQDITERKRAEQELTEKEAQLRVALDYMPGAIVYTDEELNIVVCNERFADVYQAPRELLQPGSPYPNFIRYLAEHGYYGEGDIDAFVAERVESLRSPSDKTFETRTPDGRIHQLHRRRAAAGGTVTVITDITERKRAEEDLRETTEFLELTEVITRAANEAVSVEAAMQIALDHVCAHTRWPVGHAYLLDEAAGDLASSGVWHLDDAEAFGTFRSITEATRFATGVGLPGRVLASGEAAWIFDVTKDPNFPRARQASEIGVRAGAAFPVLVGAKVAAVLEFFSTEAVEAYPPLLEVMAQIGTQLGRVLERTRAERKLADAYGLIKNQYGLIKDQKDRMENELNVGRDIQMSMVPLTFPPFPNRKEIAIYGSLEPAREIGGDFFDFFFIDDDRLCFCIGDVSGKGVPAALFMAVTKTLIKSRATDDPSTASVLTHANDELSRDNPNGMFVTLFIGILDIRSGEFDYTNAGHNPPYLIRTDGPPEAMSDRHGPIVGAMKGMVYRKGTDVMLPGDILYMYTDGVTEEMDTDGQLFSDERLAALISTETIDSVEAAIDVTISAVESFRGEKDAEDDITILAIQFFGDPMKASAAGLHVIVKNELSAITTVQEKFQEFGKAHGFSKDLERKLDMIIDELLGNIILYAFSEGSEHEIEITAGQVRNRLTVTISDDGIPYNPLLKDPPDTSLAAKDRDVGGLGIFLVRKMADEIRYQRRIDTNVLTVIIHVDQSDDAS